MFFFPEELTIVQVDECKNQLLELIEQSEVITFDDSQLKKVDTVGIQLILAAITYISSQNKSLIWQSSSLTLKNSVQNLGLDEAILNQYLYNDK